MKKKQPHKLIFVGISFAVIVVGLICISFIYRSAKTRLLEDRLTAGQREVREIGQLLQAQLQSGLSREKVIKNLQKSIVNTDIGVSFICMYDTLGIELCHPNPALVGQKIDKENSYITLLNDQKTSSFLKVLKSGKLNSGIRNFPKIHHRGSEIVNVYPVAGTDWMVASHVNIPAFQSQLSNLYNKFVVVFLIGITIIILFGYLLIRILYRRYELVVNNEIGELNDEINLLNALNRQLMDSQNEIRNQLRSGNPDEDSKKRIVTYHKDEVITVKTSHLAYAFLRNGLTYIRTFSDENYPVNGSLDELLKQLDSYSFYRVNRQLIVNINAIKTIYIYGKDQLKLITIPKFDGEILISKNKVADFKKWLDR